MTDPVGLRWTAAPQQTQWGGGMLEALLPLGNDHTLRLYVDADAVHLVGPALRTLAVVEERKRLIAEGRRPSAKQVETLDNIWERATRRG